MSSPDPAAAPSLADAPIGAWLARLAAPVPDPGGGAAAGLGLATGAALTGMCAGYLPEGEARDRHVATAAAAREAVLAAAEADGAVSAALVAAYRLPADDPGRPAAIRSTMLDAAASALALARLTDPLVPVLEAAEHGAPALLPDVAVAAHLLAAGMRSCAATVRADVTAAADAGESDATVTWWRAEEQRLIAAADDLTALAERTTLRL